MTLRERPLHRQLEAYEEGWKKDHDEALRCRDFEENLTVGISIFRALVQIDVVRRQRIAQGVEEFDGEEDETLREFFRWWLRSGDPALVRLRYFEDRFGVVEGAAEFRRCFEEAQEIVTEWKPAGSMQKAEAVQDPVRSHTDRAMTAREMSEALERVSRPTEQSSVPLKSKPDDYPLF